MQYLYKTIGIDCFDLEFFLQSNEAKNDFLKVFPQDYQWSWHYRVMERHEISIQVDWSLIKLSVGCGSWMCHLTSMIQGFFICKLDIIPALPISWDWNEDHSYNITIRSQMSLKSQLLIWHDLGPLTD